MQKHQQQSDAQRKEERNMAKKSSRFKAGGRNNGRDEMPLSKLSSSCRDREDGKGKDESGPYGEVGRVLLNSTILGYSKGIDATCQHFSKLNVLPVKAGPRISSGIKDRPQAAGKLLLSAFGRSVQEKEGSGDGEAEGAVKGNTGYTTRQEDLEERLSGTKSIYELRRALISETREFCALAEDNDALLIAKLAQQRKHNYYLKKRILKRENSRDFCHKNFQGSREKRSPVDLRYLRVERWRTPLECGYDSDSTAASSFSEFCGAESDGFQHTSSQGVSKSDAALRLKAVERDKVIAQARELMDLLLPRDTSASQNGLGSVQGDGDSGGLSSAASGIDSANETPSVACSEEMRLDQIGDEKRAIILLALDYLQKKIGPRRNE